MKKIKFTCPSCQARLRVPTHLAGVSAPCPKCGATITAPTDISGAVEDDSPSRRHASPENFRGRQSPSSPPQRTGSNPVPVAATGLAAAIPKSEGLTPLTASSRPVQSKTGSSAAWLEREIPAPVAETESVPESRVLVEPEIPDFDSYVSDQAAGYEDPYVVVEVLDVPIEQPPPLAPITQPIQVNQRVGILPETRSEVTVSSTSLPRLDFSLAAQEGSGISSLFFSEEGSQPGRLVVKLPQPGAEPHQFNPNDFIVPTAATEVVEAEKESPLPTFEDQLEHMGNELPPIPLEEIELPAFEETPNDIAEEGICLPESDIRPVSKVEHEPIDWSVTDINPLVKPAAGAMDLPWSSHHANAGVEETGHRTLSTEWQSMDTQPIPTLGASKAKQPREDRELQHSEFEGGSLHEGSVGNLFSQKPDSEEISARKQVSGALSKASESRDLKDEGYVLDELFGSPPGSSKGLSKTAVVMLCGIGGAAIIATVVVIFLINLMGGLDPQMAYADETDASAAKARADQPASPLVAQEPSIDGAPLVIDPVAMLRNESSEVRPAVNPADASSRETASPIAEFGQVKNPEPAESPEPPALSLDERVERIVNGTDPLAAEAVAITAPVSNPVSNPVDSAIESFKGASGGVSPTSPATSSATVSAATASNYNPPATFPAPGESDSPLRNTNDLIDAFLRAPDWEARLKYTYQGESLRPAISDYYGKWADKRIERFSLQLFQMEKNPTLGGPYWVYLVSTSDQDQGFPLIVRVEDGNLKVDWEIYSEFFDRHFVRFRDGKMPRPASFRVVVERVSDYYGNDREGFTDLGSYNVYQINPPYGDLNEFSEYAFVKKDTELAKQLDAVVGLNEEPLAVIITLDEKPFAHGEKHYLITEYVTEGWFR